TRLAQERIERIEREKTVIVRRRLSPDEQRLLSVILIAELRKRKGLEQAVHGDARHAGGPAMVRKPSRTSVLHNARFALRPPGRALMANSRAFIMKRMLRAAEAGSSSLFRSNCSTVLPPPLVSS